MRCKIQFILLILFMPVFRMVGDEVVEPIPFEMMEAIQPRTGGAFWVYASRMYDEGKWQSAGSSREDVQEVIELDGVKCYKVQLTIDWRGIMDRLAGQKLTEDDYSYYWEYVSEKGSYNYSGGDSTEIKYPAPKSLDQFELTLAYPVEKGHKYIAEDSQYEVLETGAKIKVPAGEFVCTVYQILYDEDSDYISRQRFYMSKGVGLIRWEEYEKIDEKWQLTSQDDLSSYDLKLPINESVDSKVEVKKVTEAGEAGKETE